jgi:hypothetical protein
VTRNTSVLSILYLSLMSFSAVGSEMAEKYNACLKEAKERMVRKQLDDCGGNHQDSADPAALKKCTDDAREMEVISAEADRCWQEAKKTEEVDSDLETSDRKIVADDGTGPAAVAKEKVQLPRPRPPQAGPRVAPAKAPAAAAVTPPKKNTPASPGPATNPSPNDPPTQPNSPTGYPIDLVMAEIEADQDVARCAASYSTANECCNNPMACSDQLNRTDGGSLNNLGSTLANGPNAGGLSGYCQQMNNLGYNAGNVNTGLSGICFASHASCSNTCGHLARKYSDYLANCGGCEAMWIFQNALRNLSSSQSACGNLRGRSDQLAMTGLGTSNNQALAQYCQQLAVSPPGSPGSAPTSNSPFINHLLAANCETNPEGADCKSVQPVKKGTSGFDEFSRTKSPDFNVNDPNYSNVRTQSGDSEGNGIPSAAAKVGAVPNNSGGAIPGAGTEPAKLTGKQLAAAGRGMNTDVDGGLTGGGGYSYPAGNNGGRGENETQYVPMSGNGSQFENIDLRQFLPGGTKAALRRLAGIGEINAKEEDIFLRISAKMLEKCRLGILWQCR